MTDTTPAARHSTPRRDRNNQRRIVVWGLVWMGTWLAAALALERAWLPAGMVGAGVALLTAALGVGMLLAYRRFLGQADELRRKIELDALAVAFGVGVVGGMTYWLLAQSGVVAEPDLLHVLMLMIVAHPLGIWLGFRRYA